PCCRVRPASPRRGSCDGSRCPVPGGDQPPWARRTGDRLVLDLRVQPGAPRSEVAGTLGGSLKVRLAAPANDGKANAELVRFLAERLGVPRRAVRITRGERSRSKAVEVTGAASLAPIIPDERGI